MSIHPPQIGDIAPSFSMLSTKDIDSLNELVSLEDHLGKSLVLFFYPLAFTLVCPTELIALSEPIEEVKALDADVLGVSVDSVHVHRAWMHAAKQIGRSTDELLRILAALRSGGPCPADWKPGDKTLGKA